MNYKNHIFDYIEYIFLNFFFKTVTLEHPSNTNSLIDVTSKEILTWLNVVQFLNELLGILLFLPEIVSDEEHPKKAFSSIDSIEEGKDIWDNEEHLPMDLIGAFNMICPIDEQPLNKLSGIAFISPVNVNAPILVITLVSVMFPLNELLGIVSIFPEKIYCFTSIKISARNWWNKW